MTGAPFTAAPRDRVLTVLELARELEDGLGPVGMLDLFLDTVGVPAMLELEEGDSTRVGAAEQLLEADERYRDLETRGRDALEPLDELPRGVSLERLLVDELERAYGEVDRLVEAIATTLS